MAILTRQEFSDISLQKAGTRSFSQILNENRRESYLTNSIFLSHSHNDKDLIDRATTFFKDLGITVYVDWADPKMPENPNGETANRIKSQIDRNNKFVFLATNAGVDSKWCNWEVGIGDTFKLELKKMALLPLADNKRNWNGNEYLNIYPRIEEDPSYSSTFVVIYPNGTRENLKDWLRRI